MVGAKARDLFPDEEEIGLYVITNSRKIFGAFSAIALLPDLKKMFPGGFWIIPSSLHEMLLATEGSDDVYRSMIEDVNKTTVDPTDVLGKKAYKFN